MFVYNNLSLLLEFNIKSVYDELIIKIIILLIFKFVMIKKKII